MSTSQSIARTTSEAQVESRLGRSISSESMDAWVVRMWTKGIARGGTGVYGRIMLKSDAER